MTVGDNKTFIDYYTVKLIEKVQQEEIENITNNFKKNIKLGENNLVVEMRRNLKKIISTIWDKIPN